MPVLPLVGSTMTVSLSIFPARSPASIIAKPMRSFTLAIGLKNSHLASTVAWSLGIKRLIRTSGVPPIVSVMSLKIRPWGFSGIISPDKLVQIGRAGCPDRHDQVRINQLQLAVFVEHPNRHAGPFKRREIRMPNLNRPAIRKIQNERLKRLPHEKRSQLRGIHQADSLDLGSSSSSTASFTHSGLKSSIFDPSVATRIAFFSGEIAR